MYYLGVDGGGSGCRAVLADAAGRILGRGAAGPANVFSNPEGAQANVLAASAQAMAGVCGANEVVAALGLAGVNVAGAGLAQKLPFARSRVETDVVIALKGALGDAPGIVATIGTGSVFARQQGGELRVIGGWGLTLGDEGGGAWLGRALCAQALSAADGLAENTPFLAEIVTDLGGPAGVVRFAAQATPADFAALAPRITNSDDTAALRLLELATEKVAAAIALLQPRAGSLPVVFLGGLGACYAARLSGRWPIGAPLGDALDGALRLALRFQAENSDPVRVER